MESAQSDEVDDKESSHYNSRIQSRLNTKQNNSQVIDSPTFYPPAEILINLTPKEIHYVNKKPKSHSKEPKFVPYEPYKAAIRPIVPLTKNNSTSKKKSSKNNLDLNVLVSQMALIDTNPIPFKSSKKILKPPVDEQPCTSVADLSKSHWEGERQEMKQEIVTLHHTIDTLQDRIKQQAQVNFMENSTFFNEDIVEYMLILL